MNYYTDSYKLQQQLESVIDKRSGRIFGPPATKKLIYFIDDLNMPKKDTFGSHPPLELIRQWIDYNFWYDRAKILPN